MNFLSALSPIHKLLLQSRAPTRHIAITGLCLFGAYALYVATINPKHKRCHKCNRSGGKHCRCCPFYQKDMGRTHHKNTSFKYYHRNLDIQDIGNEGHRNRNDHRVERKPVPLPVQLPSTPFQSPIEPVTHIRSPQSPFSGFPPPPGFRQKLLAPGTPYNWDLIPNALVVDSEPHQPVIPRTPPAPPNTAINNRPHQMGPTQRYLQGVLPPHATERHENPLTPPGYRSPTRQGIEDITLLTNPTWRLGEPLTLPAGPGHYPLRPENLVGQLSTQDVADQGVSRVRHDEDSVSQGLIISNAISNYNEPVLGLQTPPTIRELLEESLLSSQASSEWNLMNIQGRQANNNPFRSPQ